MAPSWIKAKWWYWRARREVRRKHYRSAFSYFERALTLLPEDVHTLCYAGYCLGALRQYEEAVKMYDLALQIRPDSAYAHAQLGRMFLQLQRPREAVDALNRAFRIQPNLKKQTLYWVALARAAEIGRAHG